MIVGAEHVSFSAVATLAHGGASVAGPGHRAPETPVAGAFRAGAAVRYRAPVWSRTRLSAIHGAERVESVELTELDSGSGGRSNATWSIFTADWIPDHELAVMAGCDLDSGSLRTARRSGAADDRRRACSRRATCCIRPRRPTSALSTAATWQLRWLPICEVPGEWPARTAGGRSRSDSRGSLPNLLLADGHASAARPFPPPLDASSLRRARIRVRQDGRELWSGRVGRLVPGRSAHIPSAWTGVVDPAGGPVIVAVK